MKRNKKILKWTAITGTALLVLGTVLSILAFAMTGFQFFQLTTPPKEEQKIETVSFEENHVADVSLDIDFCAIQIEGKAQSDITLTLPTNELSYEVSNGTLRVSQKKNASSRSWRWYRLLNISSQLENKAILSLPVNFSGQIELRNNFGDLDLSNLEKLSRLSVDMNYGSMKISGVKVQSNVNLKSDFGSITLQNCQTNSGLIVSSSNGGVTANELSFLDGEFSLSFGSLRLGEKGHGVTCQNLKTTVENGSTTLTEVAAAQGLECYSEFGEISLREAVSESLLLRNENGAISGTIAGKQEDYQVIVETEFGSSNLSPKLSGSCLLDARTAFGNINLNFSQG